MTTAPANPHPPGSDHAELWEICVRRDILSFVAADWQLCAVDFAEEGFAGWNACLERDPRRWRMDFPSLSAYRDAWLRDAKSHALRSWRIPPATSLFSALTLARVEVTGDTALVHKRFDGELHPLAGPPLPLRWQSIFHLQKTDGRWRQRGFVGYLPLEACESAAS